MVLDLESKAKYPTVIKIINSIWIFGLRLVYTAYSARPISSLLLLPINLSFISDDAIRIIKAGGFYINHHRINKIDEVITQSAHILPNLISLLRVGKRNHYIVKWQT